MAVCYIDCEETVSHLIREFPDFREEEIIEVEYPITASTVRIDMLVAGPSVNNPIGLAATICDWNIPPVALFILPEQDYESKRDQLSYHPRVGRSVFFCEDNEAGILKGLEQIHAYYRKRESVPLDHRVSGHYNTNNISPRWLFQAMMEHMDEYIYFKDKDSRFLAVKSLPG